MPPTTPPPAGRNAPCPCGSGRKWKKCCATREAAGGAGEARDAGGARGGGSPSRPGRVAAPVAAPVAARVEQAARLAASGGLAAAERQLQEVLREAPDRFDALMLLGRVRALDGRGAAAAGPLRAAASLRGRDPEPRLALAAALRAARDPEGAEAALREAAEVAPADHRAWSLLASLERERGDVAAAGPLIDRAAALAPADPTVRLVQAGLRNDAGDAAGALEVLQPLVARPPADSSLRGEFEAERARALESSGRLDEAWLAVMAANRAQAADPAIRSIDRGRAAAWIDAYAAHLPPGKGPVADPGDDPPPFDLLVGFPRSGTTMLEQVLAAHPLVATSGERPIVQRLKRTLGSVADDPDAFARRVATMDAAELGRLRRRLGTIAREEVPGDHPRLIHKHPMDALELPLLERLMPDARILHAVRDPRDVCVSCLKQRFVPNMTNVHFLDPATTVALQRRMAEAWFAGREQLRAAWIEVRYEDVAGDLETTARRVLDFLGLPWDDAVLSFHRVAAGRWISTPSARAVRKAPHRRAIGGWRRYAEPLAPVAAELAALARRWGYDPS